ncbi:MAG TPA: hypothetical protein VE995_08025, partial [Gaiellaceae bacterium]|nr:hypothetical protein [Gaiellaceae bacterium]
AAAAFVAAGGGGVAGDAPLFVRAGRTLLSAHWTSAFAVPTVQAGPLQLALFGALGRWPGALAIVLGAATALLVTAAARAVGVRHPVLLAAVGLLATATGLTERASSVGHPADAMLPLLWILAAATARRGQALSAGLLVGLSAGLETWGILGVAALALAPRRRDAWSGAAVAAITAGALFAPFVLGGRFAMWAYAWHVQPPSPLSLVLPWGTVFGWPLRLAQGALSVGAGLATGLALRRSPHAPWAAPLAVVVARLQLDPLLFPYYLAGPQGPLVVAAVLGVSRLPAWGRRRAAPRPPRRGPVAARS